MTIRPLLALALALAIAACGEEAATSIDAPAVDGRTTDAGVDAPIDAPGPTATLTIVAGGTGTGGVRSSPAGIDCGPLA